MAYSASPECKCTAANVPMQPRKCRSRPIFHVTNSGLQTHSFHHNADSNTKFTRLWWLVGD